MVALVVLKLDETEEKVGLVAHIFLFLSSNSYFWSMLRWNLETQIRISILIVCNIEPSHAHDVDELGVKCRSTMC